MTAATPGFPDARSLCERCGYSLQSLTPDQSCPECGQPVSESDPAAREGLPWQRRATPSAWLRTLLTVVGHPKAAFRRMVIGGPSARDRFYLLTFAAIVGLMSYALWTASGHPPRDSIRWGIQGGVGVVLLCYIEALGVAFFSRQRGWRVSWRTAERIVCYASPTWIPAAVCYLGLRWWQSGGFIWDYFPAARQWGPLRQLYDMRDIMLPLFAGILAMLWFESLVALGVRQLKFANYPPPRVAGSGVQATA